jgi:hypothetical protein
VSQRHIDLAHVDGIDVEHVLSLSFLSVSQLLNCVGSDAVDESLVGVFYNVVTYLKLPSMDQEENCHYPERQFRSR